MSSRTFSIRRWLAALTIICLVVTGGLAGIALSNWTVGSKQVAILVAHASDPAEAVPASGSGFAPVLKPALPAVVNISSSRIVKAQVDPFLSDPFFGQFFGNQLPRTPPQHRVRGLGSGVIVSANGYILTNNHVVEQANEIKVGLPDGREFPGKVVGADPKTDIAVVKIDASGFTPLVIGDSSKLQVGDYVLAIGDPYGIGETATMGIVSATGRGGLDIENYEDFIQTDAAINPGNSGGALINARGELIGINTAILSGGGGGNQGIGFAVPINMARYVMEEIVKNGKVVRGYMGIVVQELTPELARVFTVPSGKGVLIGDVAPDGPAAKAGMQKGDVVTELNGEPVTGMNDLKLRIARLAPGSTARLKVYRNGQPRELSVTVVQLPEKPSEQAAGESGEAGPKLGVSVGELTPEIARQLGLRPGTKGVVISEVVPGSAASEAGLQRGDVIEEVNRQPVTSVEQFQRLVRQAGTQTVVLSVNRGGNSVFVTVRPQ